VLFVTAQGTFFEFVSGPRECRVCVHVTVEQNIAVCVHVRVEGNSQVLNSHFLLPEISPGSGSFLKTLLKTLRHRFCASSSVKKEPYSLCLQRSREPTNCM